MLPAACVAPCHVLPSPYECSAASLVLCRAGQLRMVLSQQLRMRCAC